MPKIRGSMVNSKTCARCITRKKLGFCPCADHCIDHDYTKIEYTPNYRNNLEKKKLITQKTNKLRPNVKIYD